MSHRDGTGQENPRREQKVLFLAAVTHQAGRALEIGLLKHMAAGRRLASDEEDSVEQQQSAQPGHERGAHAPLRIRRPQSL